MNQKELNIQRRKVWNSYHIPGCGNLNRIKKNALFVRGQNSFEHELAKFDACYRLLKDGHEFITEAERNRKLGEARVIVDIVDLDTGMEIEIETNKARAKGLNDDSKIRNVKVINLWEEKKVV